MVQKIKMPFYLQVALSIFVWPVMLGDFKSLFSNLLNITHDYITIIKTEMKDTCHFWRPIIGELSLRKSPQCNTRSLDAEHSSVRLEWPDLSVQSNFILPLLSKHAHTHIVSLFHKLWHTFTLFMLLRILKISTIFYTWIKIWDKAVYNMVYI